MSDDRIKEIWVTFAGVLETAIVRRAFEILSSAVREDVKTIHLLIHSPGGTVGDGIALYYFMKSLPVNIVAYNSGSVSSAATTFYLGAGRRIVSEHSTFMVHKTIVPVPNMATGPRLHAASSAVALDDMRTEAILREHVHLSSEQWDVHRFADLTLSASESIQCGLAHEIGFFSPSGPLLNI